jgi:hypothetical protein
MGTYFGKSTGYGDENELKNKTCGTDMSAICDAEKDNL